MRPVTASHLAKRSIERSLAVKTTGGGSGSLGVGVAFSGGGWSCIVSIVMPHCAVVSFPITSDLFGYDPKGRRAAGWGTTPTRRRGDLGKRLTRSPHRGRHAADPYVSVRAWPGRSG